MADKLCRIRAESADKPQKICRNEESPADRGWKRSRQSRNLTVTGRYIKTRRKDRVAVKHKHVQSKQRERKSKREIVRRRLAPYSSLTTRQKSTYDRTTNLITDVRGGKGSWPELLRKHHLDSRTARKNAGRDLLGGTRGKPVRASKADRRVRDLLFPMPTGDVPIRTRSSRDATKLSEYYNDRDKLLRGKLAVAHFEAKWQGVRVAGQELFADAAQILRMANADALKVESLYASVGYAE
jgi:hypothetical protein